MEIIKKITDIKKAFPCWSPLNEEAHIMERPAYPEILHMDIQSIWSETINNSPGILHCAKGIHRIKTYADRRSSHFIQDSDEFTACESVMVLNPYGNRFRLICRKKPVDYLDDLITARCISSFIDYNPDKRRSEYTGNLQIPDHVIVDKPSGTDLHRYTE